MCDQLHPRHHSRDDGLMAQGKSQSQQLRIIGGKWRGRKVRFASQAGLRPTLGRTRETLFNWVRPSIHQARVLDLFAGSGALGFEALSQGAERCVLVEKNRRTAQVLKDQAAQLECGPECVIECSDALAYLRRTDETFDLVFLDPPFDTPHLLEQSLAALPLSEHALIYVETADLSHIEQLGKVNQLEIFKSARAGATHSALLRGL